MTALITARPLAFIAGFALLIAACGSGAATTPPGATGSAGSTVAPATQGPRDTGGTEPTFALPSFDLPSGDEELENLLPDEIAGATVQKFSMTGDAFLGAMGTPEVQNVLDHFDKQPSDLSVAFGGTDALALIAYRLKGVDGGQFFNAFLLAAGEDGPVGVTDASYGGKAVKKIVSPDPDIGTVYVYTAGDVMFIVGDEDITDALLTEAFSKIG